MAKSTNISQLQQQIDGLSEAMETLGNVVDDRPKYMQALYPTRLQKLRSDMVQQMNTLKLRILIASGKVRVHGRRV